MWRSRSRLATPTSRRSRCDARVSSPAARARLGLVLLTVVTLAGGASAGWAQTPLGVGRSASPAEIEGWGAIVGPDGDGLPPGSATAVEGRDVYRRRCARCHGPNGNDGPDDRLVGGVGSLATEQARKTVGSYWPVATTLWDYVNRAMPFDDPGALTPDEVYGAVAYVLYLNDIVGETDPIGADTLASVEMPNRDGFVPDPRPDGGESSPGSR